MEARLTRIALSLLALSVCGASYRTQNFVVTAASDEMAKAVGDTAEKYRHDLAVEWLGKALPAWGQPCPIRVDCAPGMGAGGATSFVFDRGEVFQWDMQIQGPPDRLLDSVLPHEVTHTIFATHFRQPLPRWADEGACTTVEHDSERNKQSRMLVDFLQTKRGIAFSKMFAMRDYPPDILPLYSQGHSLASFLIDQGGRKKFVRFVGDGLKTGAWGQTIQAHYGYDNLGDLQTTWLEWVRQSSPMPVPLALRGESSDVQVASNDRPAAGQGSNGQGSNLIYRGQSADPAPLADDPNRPSVYERRGRGAAPQQPPAQLAGSPAPANPASPPVTAAPLAPLPGPVPTAGDSSVYARRTTPTASVRRPQRVAAPRPERQVILEWSRDEEQRTPAPAAPPEAPRVAATAPPVYYDAPADMAPLRR